MIALIVDDTAEERKLLSMLFHRKGWEAVEATDGEEGLRLARQHLPDLIISDALMPKLDGFQLLWEVRRSHLKDTPFIIFTATYRDYRDEDFAVAAGADAFIEKPFRASELWSMVEEVLERRNRGEVPEVTFSEDEFLRGYHDVLVRKLREKV